MEEEIRITTELQGGVAAKRNTILGVNVSAEAECFRGINRKRTLTAIFAASAQQMIGATFVIGYATYFLELIGITNYFNASVALYVVMLIASMAAFELTEIFGRRVLLVWPQFVLCFMLRGAYLIRSKRVMVLWLSSIYGPSSTSFQLVLLDSSLHLKLQLCGFAGQLRV